MEIRSIQPEDFYEALRLDSICYNQSSDLAITDSTAEDLKDAFGLFEHGQLRSVMISHGYRMYHDGTAVPVAGIGSVATYPEHRRKGHVRELFAVLFPRMRELGQAFSMLFPFSYPYYRSFGYELAYSGNQYTFPLAQLKPGNDNGSLEMIVPSAGSIKELDEIRTLYRDFAAPRNLAMSRSDADWKRLIPTEPHKSQEYFYLYRNANGEAQAYFLYKTMRKTPFNIDMSVQDLAWRDSSGLQNLLARLALFHPLAVSATLCLPSDCMLEHYIPDAYTIERKILPSCMVKVVDVAAAFRATRFPSSGSLVMHVKDDTLDWNDGSFLVQWSGGVTEASPTTRNPDLSLDVRTLAQLLVGYIGGAELMDHGLAESSLSREQLAAIFLRKALYQNDHF
ncbi:MAG: enhanced intracellular survival protein Eis [Clostridia bacterium]